MRSSNDKRIKLLSHYIDKRKGSLVLFKAHLSNVDDEIALVIKDYPWGWHALSIIDDTVKIKKYLRDNWFPTNISMHS